MKWTVWTPHSSGYKNLDSFVQWLQNIWMVSSQNSRTGLNALNSIQVTLTVITKPDVSALWAHTLQGKQWELSKRVLCADVTLSGRKRAPILRVLLHYTTCRLLTNKGHLTSQLTEIRHNIQQYSCFIFNRHRMTKCFTNICQLFP